MADNSAPAVQDNTPAPAVAYTPPVHDVQVGPSVSPPQPETKVNAGGVDPEIRAEALRQANALESSSSGSVDVDKIAAAVYKKLKSDLNEIQDLLREVVENTSGEDATEEDEDFINDDVEEDDEDDDEEEDEHDEDMAADTDAAVATEVAPEASSRKRKSRRV